MFLNDFKKINENTDNVGLVVVELVFTLRHAPVHGDALEAADPGS